MQPSCIHILRWSPKRSVKERTWTGSAVSTNKRECSDVYWSWALSLVWEVALSLVQPSFIHILRWCLKRSVTKRTWTGSAFSTNDRECSEVYWSWALSLACEAALSLVQPSCIHIFRWSHKHSVKKRTWSGSAVSTNERECSEVYWSWALSLVWEVTLTPELSASADCREGWLFRYSLRQGGMQQ